MSLFDMMRGAGGGDAFSALASQYGLTQEQVAKAVEAFMPAFSAGLKRRAADPLGLMQLMQAMARGDYPRAYRNPAWAFEGGRREGEDALAFAFGSPEIARKAAELAAAYTGLAQETLEKLQAPLAAMLLGGLAEQSSAGNPVLDAMLKQLRAGAKAPPKGKGPLDRYEEEQESHARERSGAADLGRAQEHMMEAGLAAFQAGTAAWQEAMAAMLRTPGAAPAAKPQGAVPSDGDLFGELLEPGIRLSEAYQREVQAMLERLSPDTRRR